MAYVGAFLIVCWLAGWKVFSRNVQLQKKIKNASLLSDFRLSVVIPARNEELRIAPLLKSLKDATPAPFEVMVVDDASTDNTAKLAQDFGFRVLSSQSLPDGWKGKPWVCYQGAQAAQGNWILFLDADTFVEIDFQLQLSERLTSSLTSGADHKWALSWLPYHRVQTPYENLSSVFQLVMAMGSGAFTSEAKPKLFGQSLLVPREEFLREGAHSLVKKEVLENFVMTEILREKGWQVASFLGQGVVNMRMFPFGLSDLWSGWRKSMKDGAAHTHPKVLFYVSVWIFGVMSTFSFPLFFTFPIWFWFAFYALYVFQLHLFFSNIGNFKFYTRFLYPAFFVFYQLVFIDQLLFKKRKVAWKGRAV